MSSLANQIQREVQDYLTKDVDIGEGIPYSQNKLVKRITLFENKHYPKGKFDSQGNYKYWFDGIGPAIDAEVKNIDFDTKNIEVYSHLRIHEVLNIIVNLKLDERLRETGQAEEINSGIEEGSGWGNVVWKKVSSWYERVDLRNFYVINQTARTLKESAAIERHQLTQTDLRAKQDKWKNVKEIIESCGENAYKKDAQSTEEQTTTPVYTIFERNGEVCLKDLKEETNEKVEEGDSNKYVLAKVIVAATQGTNGSIEVKYVAFAGPISKMPYKEYHRGRYKGKWFREGLYELLFDVQVRLNEIGNQIARGLEWASKTVFSTPDKLIIRNIITDLKNGDIIRSANGLKQVEMRMQGFDQLRNEWNAMIELRNEIANSREIVQGEAQPGQPFRLGALLNVNANKVFEFIREKYAIPLTEVFEEWNVPAIVDEIKAEDVLRLTGDSDMLQRIKELIVENWYIHNLIAIGPHSPEIAVTLKEQKMEELKKQPLFIKEFKDLFESYKARVAIVITGENVDLPEKLQTLATFISMETDPVRRSYLIEKAMRLKGIDVGELPRSTPEQLSGAVPEEKPSELALQTTT